MLFLTDGAVKSSTVDVDVMCTLVGALYDWQGLDILNKMKYIPLKHAFVNQCILKNIIVNQCIDLKKQRPMVQSISFSSISRKLLTSMFAISWASIIRTYRLGLVRYSLD